MQQEHLSESIFLSPSFIAQVEWGDGWDQSDGWNSTKVGTTNQQTRIEEERKKERDTTKFFQPKRGKSRGAIKLLFLWLSFHGGFFLSLSLSSCILLLAFFFFGWSMWREREREVLGGARIGRPWRHASSSSRYPSKKRENLHAEREVRPGFPRRHLVVGFQPANHTRPTIHR